MRQSIVSVGPSDLLNLEAACRDILVSLERVEHGVSVAATLTLVFRPISESSQYRGSLEVNIEHSVRELKSPYYCDPIEGIRKSDFFFLLGTKAGNLVYAMTRGRIWFVDAREANGAHELEFALKAL